MIKRQISCAYMRTCVNVATYLFFSAICCTYAVVMNKIRDVQSVCYKKEMVKNAELSIQFSEHDSC